jgi:hypothetical protein
MIPNILPCPEISRGAELHNVAPAPSQTVIVSSMMSHSALNMPNTLDSAFKKNNLDDWLNFLFKGIIFNETYIYVTTLNAPGDRFE